MAGDTSSTEKRDGQRKNISFKPVQLTSEQVPEGAVMMTKNEVIEMHLNTIKNYKPQSEMWPFKFGGTIVATSAAIAGFFINQHFRHKFVLRNYGLAQTYLPVVVFPMLCSIGAQVFIKQSVVTRSDCPTCISVRAGVLQVLCSTIYSAAIAGPICIQLSKSYHTYVLTKNNFQPNVIHALKTKPFAWYCYLGLTVFNFAAGYFTAHVQGRALEKANAKKNKSYFEGNMAWK